MSRSSFIIHTDSLEIIKELSDEQAGKLFKAIRAYHKNEEIELDQILKVAFIPLRNQFERDFEKYESIRERNKNNGLKGGRPKNPEKPKKPTGLSGNPEKPKKADNGNDNGNGNDNVNKKENTPLLPSWLPKEDWDGFLEMRKKTKKPPTDRAVKMLLASLEDFKNKGFNISKILQDSIMNNWAGLYPPKDSQQKPKAVRY